MLLDAVTGMARVVPLKTGYRFADALSDVHRWSSRSRRRAVEDNLRALGVDEPETRVPSVYRNFGRSLFEFLRGPHLPEIPVRFEGWEHLEAGLARQRGAVVTAPHAGNWGQAAAAVARRGYAVAAVADIQLKRSWTPALRRRQERDGIRILPPGVGSWREIPRLLASNHVIALLVDGDVFRGGLDCPVGNRIVRIPTGPARLAISTGAALIPGWVLRDQDGGTRVGFGPEIDLRRNDPEEIERATREVLTALLEGLRRHPDQWVLFRRFFHDSPGTGLSGGETP